MAVSSIFAKNRDCNRTPKQHFIIRFFNVVNAVPRNLWVVSGDYMRQTRVSSNLRQGRPYVS
ncbi:hypothetical protein GN958_ATG20079 [Phytophthora infestans]|uniref:Uncharacterized protein n=1 Tax=Phytophthora infestans TaxID=4787 RepID=A0A8S9TPA9_PHYIN|nr:hypothetical protein GN958_ATG20079 [Phytophthora infestans]